MGFEVLFVILALVGIIAFFLLTNKPEKFAIVDFGNVKIKTEVADTYLKRVNGLMFHKSLAENQGMLFVFDSPGKHGIWMMNMSFPIDIFWLDEEKEIIHIVENAQPCFINCPVYRPEKNAKYVIETVAGFTKRYKLEKGYFVEFNLPLK